MGPECIVGGFIAHLLVFLVKKGHADDSFDIAVFAGDVIGLHTTGGQAVKKDGAVVPAPLVVDIIISKLHPVFVADNHLFVYFCDPVQRHVNGNDFIAVLGKGAANDCGNLASVGSDAVQENDFSFGVRVPEGIQMNQIPLPVPVFFCGGVLFGEVKFRWEKRHDFFPVILV